MKFSKKKKKIHNSNPVRLYTIFQCNDKSIRFNSMFKLKKKNNEKTLLELLSIAENLFSKKASFIFRSEESPKLSSFSSNCDSSFRGYIDKYIIVYYSINQEREREFWKYRYIFLTATRGLKPGEVIKMNGLVARLYSSSPTRELQISFRHLSRVIERLSFFYPSIFCRH